MTIKQLLKGEKGACQGWGCELPKHLKVEIINTTTWVVIETRVCKCTDQNFLDREIDEWTYVPTDSIGNNKLRILVSGNHEDDILSWEG